MAIPVSPAASATASDPARQTIRALLAGLLTLVSGCAEAPLPQSQLRSDDCLRGLQIDQLQAQIRRCDTVVAAFPDRPGPLSDRSLLHMLAGDELAACRDVETATRLLSGQPASGALAALSNELQLRRATCPAPGASGTLSDRPTTPAATGAP